VRRRRLLVASFAAIVLVSVAALLLLPPVLKRPSPAAAWPTESWQTSTPEEQGLDSVKLAEGLQALANQGVPLDSVLVVRNGAMVLDASFYPYNSTSPHRLASVTKSVMTTLIAIAADQGKLDLDAPMLSFFPDRTIANLDARKEHITVRHLTGMVNGYQSGCIGKDEQTLDAMRSQPDWVQAALDRPMVLEPGVRFCYDSPGMHLLSAILQQATGMTALDFARQYLFEPLGIHQAVWRHDPQGFSRGWGDLYLAPGDAARIGFLWLNHGVWDGKPIVSADWVEESVEAQTEAGSDDYGYGWWVGSDSYYALGRGGQRISINPPLNAVVVTTGLGLDYDDVARVLLSALTDEGNPLPPNPDGLAQLQAMVASLAAAPPPQPVPSLPETARTVSDKVYVFEPNAAGVETMRFEFNDSAVATLHILLSDNEEMFAWPIGLDGVYRLTSTGEAVRGSWTGPLAFVFELTEFGEYADMRYEVRFEGDRMLLTAPALALSLEGRLQAP